MCWLVEFYWKHNFQTLILTKLETLALLTSYYWQMIEVQTTADRTTKIHLQNCNYSICASKARRCVDIPRKCLMELSPRVRTLCMKRGENTNKLGGALLLTTTSLNQKSLLVDSLSLYLALALTTYYCLICIIRQKVCQPPCVGYVPTYMLCVCYYGQHLIHYISHNTSAIVY